MPVVTSPGDGRTPRPPRRGDRGPGVGAVLVAGRHGLTAAATVVLCAGAVLAGGGAPTGLLLGAVAWPLLVAGLAGPYPAVAAQSVLAATAVVLAAGVAPGPSGGLATGLPALCLGTAAVAAGLAGGRRRRRRADRDPVTGLLDGKATVAALEGELVDGAPPLTVVLLSVDRFRDVNEAFGHRRGDLVLAAVGRAVADLPVDPLLCGRLAGDEFVIAARPGRGLPAEGLTAVEWAVALASRVRAAAAGPFRVADIDVTLETSAGCVLWPHHGATAEALLRRADGAMVEAKSQGLGSQVWQPAPDSDTTTDMLLLSEVRGAAERGELRLRYQPLVDAASGRVKGVEALVRWQHPRLGLLSPASFVELAERGGAIAAVTDWVLDTAAGQCRSWLDAGVELEVSVNVSASVLHGTALVPGLRDVLDRHDLPPSALCVEITETAVLQRPERAALVLTQLRELGVAVSVDDFGSGYTSLAMLSELPLDELKVDARFVSGLLTRHADAAIVAAVLGLAHRLGLVTVAEGVEDRTTAEELRRIGYDTLQGYLFAPPLEAQALLRWIGERAEAVHA